MNKSSHSYFELFIYFVIWIFGVLFAIYKFSCENKAFSNIPDTYHDFKQNALFFNLKKDITDLEWEATTTVLFKMFPWIVAHVVISEILRETYSMVVPFWHILIGSSFILFTTGLKGLLLFILQPIIFEFMSKLRSICAVWFTSLLSLISICYFKTFDFEFGYNFFGIDELQHFTLILVTSWTNLRCLSFYLDKLSINSRQNDGNFLKILSFCLYLPNMVGGPFLFYEQIEKCYKKENITLWKRIWTLIKDLVRFGGWYLFTEFSLHFIYASAFTFYPQLVVKFNSWALYGYGYCMGQFFHLKYVVFYGFSTSIAKFENIPVPTTPKCIGRIHLYSDMWKYFDRGLHSFLVRYIYIPTLRKKASFGKIISSFLCFSFVYVWHGIQGFVFVWAILNFAGVTLEALFNNFCENHRKTTNVINVQWQRRLACAFASPLLAMSCVSNFYFFAGIEIGNIFTHRVFNDSFCNHLTLLSILYCCCQVSTEIKNWENVSLKS